MKTAVHPKSCRQCNREFTPVRGLQAVCSPRCAQREVVGAKKTRKALERAQTTARREALKTIADRIREAQTEFNAYIRLRDRAKGCFVCGDAFPVGQLGGDFDAGHVRSRGAAGHLRFNEDNVHGECKPCNSPTGAKLHQVKAGAIARIGLERFKALEESNDFHKWTHSELIEIRARYKAKRRALEG